MSSAPITFGQIVQSRSHSEGLLAMERCSVLVHLHEKHCPIALIKLHVVNIFQYRLYIYDDFTSSHFMSKARMLSFLSTTWDLQNQS